MNASRRKSLAALRDRLAQISSEIESLRDEEQEYYDNMPVSFQDGEKGEAASAAVDRMQEAVDSLEEVCGTLEEAAE